MLPNYEQSAGKIADKKYVAFDEKGK